MGFCSGSDFDPKMFSDSGENLKWLIDKFKLEGEEPKVFLKMRLNSQKQTYQNNPCDCY